MNLQRSTPPVSLLILALFSSSTIDTFALAADNPYASAKDSVATEPAQHVDPESTTTASPNIDRSQVLAPLQGYAKHDARGTPVVPEWKKQAGYDALLGKFYVGAVGLKLFPINGPPPAAVLGAAQLEHWRGHKPHPCLLKFIKLQDNTGGYYFQSIGSPEGPRGWIIPQPAEPHKAKEWAIYFMQNITDDTQSQAVPQFNK